VKRNADGTWRNSRRPLVVSEVVMRARWVEAEALHLKKMGFSHDAIADRITQVGRGQLQALTSVPEGLTFPLDYRISRQAIFKACQRALKREPAFEAAELRKVYTARCEDMYLNLQPAIRKGNPRATDTAVKVIDLSARVNGLFAAPRLELRTGKDGKTTIRELLDEVGPLGDDEGGSDGNEYKQTG
jgi:hypothetical protein